MMKLSAKHTGRIAMLFFYCIVLLVFSLIETGCMAKGDYVDEIEILSRIKVGDERQQALQAFSDAWHHSECPYSSSDTIEDIFLYGPKQREKVTIISILSEPYGNTLMVNRVGHLDADFLESLDYGDICKPPVLSAFD